MRNILVYIESTQEGLDRASISLIDVARDLSTVFDSRVIVVTLSNDASRIVPALSKMSVDEVYVGEHPLLEWYNPELHGRIVGNLLSEIHPSIALMAHTYIGMDLGAVLASDAGIPFINNCSELSVEDGEVVALRPCYRGKVSAKISVSKSIPCIVSLAAGFKSPFAIKEARKPKVRAIEVKIEQSSLRQRIVETRLSKNTEGDITNAKTVVAIGRGIGEKVNIEIAKALAQATGGMLGCSRPLVDIGWLSQEQQIGLSGRTVAPRLYVACGISGSMEHQVGMRGSEVIVALNNDPNAPIFGLADYGIVDDILRTIPALTRAIIEAKGKSSGQSVLRS